MEFMCKALSFVVSTALVLGVWVLSMIAVVLIVIALGRLVGLVS